MERTPSKPRYRLLAPLVYLAALILLLEEWFWDIGYRLIQFIVDWPPIRALERLIRALPPYGALVVFMLPAVLLFPVKVLALFAIARGHAIAGVSVILLAKIGGAAAVARLYALTRPTLLSLAWFKRWHDGFITVKDRWIGYLRATEAFQQTQAVMRAVKDAVKAALGALRPTGGRGGMRPARVLRRFVALWRARRRHQPNS